MSPSSSSSKTVSDRNNWSRQIFILLISLTFISALLVWFAKDDDNWKLFQPKRGASYEKNYRNSPAYEYESGKLISDYFMDQQRETQPQTNHQGEAYVKPIKVNLESQESKIVGNETDGTRNRYWNWRTFRNHTAEFWDPYPEYILDAFGRHFHMVLKVNSELTVPDFKVTYVSKNYSVHQEPAVNPRGCFYSGYIKGEPNSEVSVSLCNGMRGHIFSETGGYYIEPADEPPSDNADTFLHKMLPIHDERTSSTNGECAQNRDANHVPIPDFQNSISNDADTPSHVRRKRSADEYTIELMVVVDKNVMDFHGGNTEQHILLLLNTVRSLFKHKSIGTRINVAVVNLTVLNNEVFHNMKSGQASNLLSEFCDWQAKEKARNRLKRRHHDTAILLTRENFCVSADNCSNIIGFAPVGGICGQGGNYSCALIKENGHTSAFTIAHELGHLLGMQHDDNDRCRSHDDDAPLPQKLMTRQMSHNSTPWSWSACSKTFLKEFLEQGNTECLYNNPMEFINLPSTLIGEIYSIDKQCEDLYGRGWKSCNRKQNYECQLLQCYDPYLSSQCRVDLRPWADGTPCSDNVNYWCIQRQCVSKNHRLPVIHGGWGEWQQFGECSRTCGGGVRKSIRECNNPEPSERGEWCVGQYIRYESCNTQECPKGTPDFRLSQCGRHNNKSVYWIPLIPSPSPNDVCKLTCRASNGTVRSFGPVIDGTPCISSSFDICINGKCEPAGCDHVRNSKSVLDSCGVCAGDDTTCEEKRDFFNISNPHFGYNYIGTIPVGSWDLEISQYSYDNRRDTNYLALKDPENNKYLFNGGSVKKESAAITYENIKLVYSGVDGGPPETVKSSTRLHKNLILEVLSVNNNTPFSIECRYKVPNSQKFQWEVTNEWTKCDKICYGVQKRITRCIKKETGNDVALNSCSGLTKPPYETRVCNEYCFVRWEEISRSECSSHCGKGTQQVTYRCSQQFQNYTPSSRLPEMYCRHLGQPQTSVDCNGSCDKIRWRYYEWGQCSVTCGTGVQKRRAECVDRYNRFIDESLCAHLPKKVENSCFMEECPHWSAQEWEACSVSCGHGIRKRRYWCEQKNRIVSNDLCPVRDRPSDTETCQMPACAPVWRTGEWSPCSVTCGTGTEYRSVRCSDRNEAACPQKGKPDETQMCYLPPCSRPDENDITERPTDITDRPTYDRYEWRPGSWGECSSTCGKGMKRRRVECYDTKKQASVDFYRCNEYKIPLEIESCEVRMCAQWRISSWSPCSATCGQGTKRRFAVCEQNGRRVQDAKCTEPMPDLLLPCDSYKPCRSLETTTENVEASRETWKTGRWGECSASCGGGTKVRNVVCFDSRGSTSTHCQNHDRPASSSPCNTNPCPDEVKWKFGEWSECNQTCGGGYQHRQAQCKTLKGENIPESYCNQNEIPHLVRQCENNPCVKNRFQWRTSAWSECSVSCGTGSQTRSVFCEKINEYQPAEREVVHDMRCNQATKPDATKECQKQPCQMDRFVYNWVAGPWAKCSVTCGKGFKKRWIQCEKVNELRPNEKELVLDSYCDDVPKPKYQMKCRRNCLGDSEYMWISGPWSECKGPCGEKMKYRTSQCYHKSSNLMPDVFCSNLKKPKIVKKCKHRKCDAINCSDIKRAYNTDVDQEYPIRILGRNISIYCHDMSTDHPKEFLSLPAGEHENYSEFYSKRLIDPDTCPVSKHKCCIEETTPYVGKTFFRKIRLNVTSMLVITNDFTFATTTGTGISYGEAGDCYSRRNCPQGTFSINLAGTGLKIAPSVRWSEKGTFRMINVQIYHDRRKIFGRCGGYCASCTTLEGLKLDVLPP